MEVEQVIQGCGGSAGDVVIFRQIIEDADGYPQGYPRFGVGSRR